MAYGFYCRTREVRRYLRLLAPLSEDRGVWRIIRWIVFALLCVGLVYVTIRSIVLATLVMAASAMKIGTAVQPRRRLAIFTGLAAFMTASVLLLFNQSSFYGEL
jgi:hypothetical protein